MNKNQLLDDIHNLFQISQKEINSYSPLTLAYLGDAVFEIIIRTIIVEKKSGTVKSLHRQSSDLVNAKAQAELISRIMNTLTEQEISIYKRGRNAKSHSVAKNADIHDYRSATGFEALMGYLYLNGEMERLLELIQLGLAELSE
ncbi:MAG: ribonuclease III [Eubacterium sp.]|jgi:ribonuclease-3 family protein|nr:ribonuclease III [Eubacterium sp.]